MSVYHGFAIFAMVLTTFLIFLVFFEPKLSYHVDAPKAPLDSDEYMNLLAALVDAQIHPDSGLHVLTNGTVFYDAQLAAIRSAKQTINIEHFIIQPGEIAQEYLKILTEKARAGVKVRLTIDAVGSLWTSDRHFAELREAGGKVRWYQPLRWYNFKRLNNRTHRNLLVIDGHLGFLGGAGISDRWWHGQDNEPAWRDTNVRIDGELVLGLQSTFAENWLEASEEILSEDENFPLLRDHAGDAAGLVVNSAPSVGRGTRAAILFHTLVASARESILITSPYFLPDRSIRKELIRAATKRGVVVKVITPGEWNDVPLVRKLSRRLYGELLEAGVEIYEYQPAMIHVKTLMIDHLWSVVGSSNFDLRSFGHNDEINVAIRNREVAARLKQDFHMDLEQSRKVTLEEWKRRPILERVQGAVLQILKRQA